MDGLTLCYSLNMASFVYSLTFIVYMQKQLVKYGCKNYRLYNSNRATIDVLLSAAKSTTSLNVYQDNAKYVCMDKSVNSNELCLSLVQNWMRSQNSNWLYLVFVVLLILDKYEFSLGFCTVFFGRSLFIDWWLIVKFIQSSIVSSTWLYKSNNKDALMS